MRHIVIGLIALSCFVLITGCGPTKHHQVDDWANDETLEPEISGNNTKDEARWRQELKSDPWGDDAHLLTDDPLPGLIDEEENEPQQPKDFVGPPAPPTGWEGMQKRSGKFGQAFFAVLTVLVTLGMMAAPYLMMI